MRLPAASTLVASGITGIASSLPVILAASQVAAHPWFCGGAVFLCASAAGCVVGEWNATYARERQRFLIDQFFEPEIDSLRQFDSTARLNIMRVSGLPGLRRLRFFRTYRMGDGGDAVLTLKLNQGVAGVAFEAGHWAVGDMEADSWRDARGNGGPDACRHMTQDQRDLVRELTLVYSYPIRRLARQGSAGDVRPVDDVIGVVNLDSRQESALGKYTKEGLHKALLEARLPQLALVAGYVLT